MYIYKTTNQINGKIYIGLTTMNEEESKWYFGSGDSIKKALEKHGVENFKKEILERGFSSKEDLAEAEIKWITHFKSTTRGIGYNLSPGGDLNPGYLKKSIYQYSPDGSLVKWFPCIDDAVKELQMKNSDIYKKSVRESRPIKKFWWSLEEKSPEEIMRMHQEYLGKRKGIFVDAANKRASDPGWKEANKEHMRRIGKLNIPTPMTDETKKKVSESIKGRRWYTNTNTGEHVQRREIPEGGEWVLGRLRIG
jgi:hypothetical protein